jgi:hypothetical protein
MLVLGSFQHIHSFVVDPGRMVDNVDTVFDAHLHAITGSGMGTQTNAMAMSFVHASSSLFVSVVTVLGISGFGDLLARHGKLDIVNAESDVVPDHLSHLQRTFGESRDTRDEFAVRDGHLLAIRQIAWPRDGAGVDRVTDGDIKAFLS